ncbi:hypothetical protein [Kitasatospora sp. NPDC101183]|uniref:hypothetical protein n=1 Tax=Kitasatospora sp. NPDC101183 TaxID=3364100 RepID=UPI00382E8C06
MIITEESTTPHDGLHPVPRQDARGLDGYGVLDYRKGAPARWARGLAGRAVWFEDFESARAWVERELSATDPAELEPADSPGLLRLRAATAEINGRPAWGR